MRTIGIGSGDAMGIGVMDRHRSTSCIVIDSDETGIGAAMEIEAMDRDRPTSRIVIDSDETGIGDEMGIGVIDSHHPMPVIAISRTTRLMRIDPHLPCVTS